MVKTLGRTVLLLGAYKKVVFRRVERKGCWCEGRRRAESFSNSFGS